LYRPGMISSVFTFSPNRQTRPIVVTPFSTKETLNHRGTEDTEKGEGK
jgi:hypothetical protein